MTRQNRDNAWRALTLLLTTAIRAIRLTPIQFSLSALSLAVFAFMFSFVVATSHTDARLAGELAGANRMTVYVPGGLEQRQTDGLVAWAKSRVFVQDVEQKPFDSYFSDLCASLGLDADVFGEVPSDAVPRVLVVILDSNEVSRDRLRQFITELRARSDVLDVHFGGDALLSLSELVRRFKRLVCALLSVCCLLVVVSLFSASRSVVQANDDAIGIMKLAGASATTLAGPFVCYGALLWGTGVALAFILWHAFFPIRAIRVEGFIAQLQGLVAPQLNVLDVALVALASAALSIVPLLIAHRSKLRAMDVFSC